jgi:hypothetical protein
MSRTLTIPDALYQRLEAAARSRGLESVERLIEQWDLPTPAGPPPAAPARPDEAELRRRDEVVRRIDELRERLFLKYGTMPDSTDLIREDRER